VGNLKDICFDCSDPWKLSHWWADVLGYQVRPHTEEDNEQLRREGIDRPEDERTSRSTPSANPAELLVLSSAGAKSREEPRACRRLRGCRRALAPRRHDGR
jgi:Glyoxalase-like domain